MLNEQTVNSKPKGKTMSTKAKKVGAGRPLASVKPPRAGSKFTLTDLVGLNPELAKLTLDKRLKKWVKKGIAKRTKEFQTSGEAGRPPRVYLYVGEKDTPVKAPRKEKDTATAVTSPSVQVTSPDAPAADAPTESTPAPAESPVTAPVESDPVAA